MKRANFGSRAKKAYDAATDLWFASGVEAHAEGHTGVPGPAGDGEPWDYARAHLDAAIHTLTLIRGRLYHSPPVVSPGGEPRPHVGQGAGANPASPP